MSEIDEIEKIETTLRYLLNEKYPQTLEISLKALWKVKQALAQKKAEYSALRTENENIGAVLRGKEAECAGLRKELDWEKGHNSLLEIDNANLLERAKELEKTIEEYINVERYHEKQVSDLTRQTETYQAYIKTLEADFDGLKDELEEAVAREFAEIKKNRGLEGSLNQERSLSSALIQQVSDLTRQLEEARKAEENNNKLFVEWWLITHDDSYYFNQMMETNPSLSSTIKTALAGKEK